MTHPDIEKYREHWANIAKANGWYKEPFYVKVWVDPETNEIYDSISFSGMAQDYVDVEPREDDEEEWY